MARTFIPLFGGSFKAAAVDLTPRRMSAPDIVEWIEARDPRPAGFWDEAGSEEFARAFTAARTAGYDVIDDLYFAFVDTVEAGGTEIDFANLVTPTLKAKGWLSDKGDAHVARRVQLIYETNLRLARASGKWSRIQAAKTGLPYLRGVTVRDDRVRHPPKSPHSDHRAWDGIILPVDHWFWMRYFPPLGFKCRCDTIQMTRSQLARYAGGITSEDELAERIARLGPPVFASPAMPIERRLAQMTERTNDNRMPGLPPVDVNSSINEGSRLWRAVMQDQGAKDLADLISALFGLAA